MSEERTEAEGAAVVEHSGAQPGEPDAASFRSIVQEILIAAPSEVVWRALSTAEELARWFPLDARVEPGVAGKIWLSWGEGAEGEAPIHAWEPNRHLGWSEVHGVVRMAVDFWIEAEGAVTRVRLVHSGFGSGEDWDEQFHMTEGGWKYFLFALRHYLEVHQGVPRDAVVLRRPVRHGREAAWERLLGVDGLGAGLRTAGEGAPFRVELAEGVELEGQVVHCQPHYQLALHLRTLNDALLLLELEPHPEGCRPGLYVSTFGLPVRQVTALRAHFTRLYESALGD